MCKLSVVKKLMYCVVYQSDRLNFCWWENISINVFGEWNDNEVVKWSLRLSLLNFPTCFWWVMYCGTLGHVTSHYRPFSYSVYIPQTLLKVLKPIIIRKYFSNITCYNFLILYYWCFWWFCNSFGNPEVFFTFDSFH